MAVFTLPGVPVAAMGQVAPPLPHSYCGSWGFWSSASDTLILFHLKFQVTPGRCRPLGAPGAKGVGNKVREKREVKEGGKIQQAREEMEGRGLENQPHLPS